MTHLGDVPWPAAEDRAAKGDVLLVPVGATEQHGPHLPVTTDTDLAVALCEGAAARVPAVVAPALAFGASGEHEDFAGTLSLGTEATASALVELTRSAARHFVSVVLVSTHGGNREAVLRALERLRAEHQPVLAWWPEWSGDLHAGRSETSLMLAVAPARVVLSAAEPGDPRSATALLPLLRRHGVRALSANGVLGDPRGANPEEGRRLLEAETCRLATSIRALTTAGVESR